MGSGPFSSPGGVSAQGYHPNSKPPTPPHLHMVPFPHPNLPHPEPSPLPNTSSPSIPALSPPHPQPQAHQAAPAGPSEPTPSTVHWRQRLSTGWDGQGTALCPAHGARCQVCAQENCLNGIQMKWSKAGKQKERDGESEGPESRNGGRKWRWGSKTWDKGAERQGRADRNGAENQGTGRWETDTEAVRNRELNE